MPPPAAKATKSKAKAAGKKMTSLETSAAVYFYGATDPKYGALSNFYVCEFVDDNGQRFFSSEQYFMKKKQETFDPDNERAAVAILKAKSPPVAKKLGRQVKNYDDQVWNAKRYDFMVDALKLKFGSNDALKELLLSTEEKTLYEASRSDAIWGIGVSVEKIQDAYKEQRYFREHGDIDEATRSNWFGTNLLGRALMETRSWLISSISGEETESNQGAADEEQKATA
ncbi:hypothetical protein FI667_g6623, partial [Globisporangium splendens]